jgi:hypothetical protein
MWCATSACDYVNVGHILGLFFDCPSEIREMIYDYVPLPEKILKET